WPRGWRSTAASSSSTSTRARATAGPGRRPSRTSWSGPSRSCAGTCSGGDEPMSTRFCPDCGAEYLADVDECADCLVPLMGGTAAADSDGGDEVVYELDDWEPDLLEQLAQALARNAIPFSWEDNRNLVVR